MARILNDITDAIGCTPLVGIAKYSRTVGLETPLAAKIEGLNPSGSSKDRAALSMVADAEANGVLHSGSVIVESTSGNTGIGLTMVCAVKGYRLVLAMPDTMSMERRNMLRALGAELELTPGSQGMAGAVARAEELLRTLPSAVTLDQFGNPANPRIHFCTTACEIWEDAGGQVDAFVAGVGTGGTLAGVARYLKQRNPDVHILAVQPADSPVLTGGKAASHRLQGIGANFIPGNYDASVVDEVMGVEAGDAVRACRLLASCEGILAGFSSGAALHAATMLAMRPQFKKKVVVVLLPDTGTRYMSTDLFEF